MKKVFISCASTIALVGIGLFVWFATRLDYDLRPAATLAGHGVDAAVFLADTEPMAGISAYFYGEVDFNAPGRMQIPLTLQRNSRRVRATATLYIVQPLASVRVELGDETPIAPVYFIANAPALPGDILRVRYVGPPPVAGALPVGTHRVQLSLNDIYFYSAVVVEDTTPPTVVTRNFTSQMGRAVSTQDVVASVFDLSPVTSVEIVSPPDIFSPGDHTVDVRVEDAFGNYALYASTVTFLPNTVPPIFYGVQDIIVALGEPVRFRAGVSAQDAFGRALQFDIDSGQLNVNERGMYPIVYTATDAWGLTTEATVYVHVLSVDPAVVHEMVDDLLGRILRYGMTQVQQARAIFNWITNNIALSAIGAGGRDSAYESAHLALLNRRGNCFNFYGIATVMLERSGIPTLRVDRKPGTTNPSDHRWNLINPDGLGWHHFDTTPVRHIASDERFMFTNTQAEEFTHRIRYMGGRGDFYTFDPALTPEIAP
ncbi:MAG: hypothetical protein FWB88_10560 [Defluviitaleaceae bacterium]|nr:hypothetical protein [Defluviitaleaceae bacterium]MCL2239912.1 hypothetical protein [Defluviitaleaceae bacterium]